MSKIEPLTPINSSYTGIAKLNAHLVKIENALENTLSRDGSSPNQMEADIDMNDNQLINVAEPTLAHNVATKAYVDDTLTENGMLTQADIDKLDGIEALADVTDAANVAAAGAVMDGDFGSNGLMGRTGAGAYTSRSIAAGYGLTVANGDGVSGNPTPAVDPTIVSRFVATYAALTALVTATGLVDNGIYCTYGRTAEEDGGFGFWRYDSGSSATANGGTILAIDGGGAGRFFRLDVTRMNVRWFGAKPDGSTDNTSASQAAQTAAEAAGVPVYYPGAPLAYVQGVVNIGANDVVIEGDGEDLTTITQKDASDNYAFFVNGYDRVTIRQMSLDGNKSNQTTVGSGVRVEGAADDFTLEHVHAINWKQFGISLAGTGVRPSILHSKLESNDISGFISAGFTDGRAVGNTAISNGYDGIGITGSSHRWTLDNNIAKSNTLMGIAINSSNDVVTSGNICWSNTGHGIHHNTALRCSTNNNNCQSNGISGVDFYASPDGCSTNDYSDNNTVRGIEIDSASDRTKAIGLRTNGNNGDVDISIFRSADAEVIGCNGDVRIWDAGVISSSGHTIAAAGSGYTDGTHTVTVSGGTFGTAAQLSVAVSGGAVTAINSVVDDGDYWTLPANPVSVTGLPGGGSGATFNLEWSGDSSDTCAGAQIIGGGQGTSNALTVVSGSSSSVHLLGWQGTVSDPGAGIASAQACPQYRKPTTALSLQNSWVARGAGYNTPGFVLDGEGFCTLVGQMKDGTVAGNTLIATLPAGARPPETIYLPVVVSGSIGGVYIASDGTIKDLGGSLSATWSSLDGLRFKVA